MISYSAIQYIASDVEFAAAILTPGEDAPRSAVWWLEDHTGKSKRELIEMGESLKLAAKILNTLTIEQVEALPSHLNR